MSNITYYKPDTILELLADLKTLSQELETALAKNGMRQQRAYLEQKGFDFVKIAGILANTSKSLAFMQAMNTDDILLARFRDDLVEADLCIEDFYEKVEEIKDVLRSIQESNTIMSS